MTTLYIKWGSSIQAFILFSGSFYLKNSSTQNFTIMNTYGRQAHGMVRSQLPLVAPISSATLGIVVYQTISFLPGGGLFEVWTLHSRARAVGLDIGMKIAIFHSQEGLDGTGHSRALVIANITSVAYCDREQVVFRMQIEGDHTTSMLSMPVRCTSISHFRRLLYQLYSFTLPSPPLLPKAQSYNKTSPNSLGIPQDDS